MLKNDMHDRGESRLDRAAAFERGGLVSVIVPVYNVKLYLAKCVDTLVRQTYTQLEIILVDDGSTDGSGDICEALKEKDCRICVIHQKNSGVAAARNMGLKHAHGQYLAFVDADDYLDIDIYEVCVKTMRETESDCVKFGMIEEYADAAGRIAYKKLLRAGNAECVGGKEISDYVLQTEAAGYVYNAIYKTEVLRRGSMYFNERLRVNEDMDFSLRWFAQIKKLVCIDRCAYHYMHRIKSGQNSLSKQKGSNAYAVNAVAKLQRNLTFAESCRNATQKNLEKIYWQYIRHIYGALSEGEKFETVRRSSEYQNYSQFYFQQMSIKQKLLIGVLRTENDVLIEHMAVFFGWIKRRFPIVFAKLKR